jgi:NAD-reducing hydrogenase small subunit
VKKKLATVWLDGCSGCHMSFLDMDERLIDLAKQFDLVYSPIVDHKIFPQGVDISLVEGSRTHENAGFARRLRRYWKCSGNAKRIYGEFDSGAGVRRRARNSAGNL